METFSSSVTYPAAVPRARRAANEPPREFAIDRTLGPGRHPLLAVFPGLDRLPAFSAVAKRHPDGEKDLVRVAIELVSDDIWMYVAPTARPPDAPPEWTPVIAKDADVIVVGLSHLRESPAILLYLDILHELCHIAQRRRGLDLWDRRYGYVDRPTEVEAYEFVIEEARRLGATKPFLREYLRVEWVSEEDYQRLLDKMGLSEG